MTKKINKCYEAVLTETTASTCLQNISAYNCALCPMQAFTANTRYQQTAVLEADTHKRAVHINDDCTLQQETSYVIERTCRTLAQQLQYSSTQVTTYN